MDNIIFEQKSSSQEVQSTNLPKKHRFLKRFFGSFLIILLLLVGLFIISPYRFIQGNPFVPQFLYDAAGFISDLKNGTRELTKQKNNIITLSSALRNYAKEHDGTYPSSLQLLVPDYINKVPSDPIAKSEYQYSTIGKTFAIHYLMTLPSKLDEVQKVQFTTGFVDGANTMTEKMISRESFAQNDFDADGLNGAEEIEAGSDDFKDDTDADGKTDKEELAAGTNPAVNEDPDSDHDGLTDRMEITYGTNSKKTDTDDDGKWDGPEVRDGTDPTKPLRLGDPSYIVHTEGAWSECIDTKLFTNCNNYCLSISKTCGSSGLTERGTEKMSIGLWTSLDGCQEGSLDLPGYCATPLQARDSKFAKCFCY